MLADTELPLARDPSLLTSFESHLKHSLLFNEHLMLSDAQAVNCSNLRNLINHKPDFKELLTPDLFSIAIRAPKSDLRPNSLHEVRNSFYKEGKQNMHDKRFMIDTDLDILEERCHIEPYTYPALRENYTNSVFELFRSENAIAILGLEVVDVLDALFTEENTRNNGLGRVFIQKNLERKLDSIGRQDIWHKHASNIIKLSDAPYVTGIPTILNTNPIYAPVHQESFKLAYNNALKFVDKVETIKLATNLDLHSYESALALLNPEDILTLRQSYQFLDYQNNLNSCVETQNQLSNTAETLAAYQELIDEYIIRKRLGLKTPKQFKGKRYLDILQMSSVEGVNLGLGFAFGAAGLAVAGPVGLAITNVFIAATLKHKSNKEKHRIAASKRKYQIELSREGVDSCIAAEQVSNHQNYETIYSSINKV